MAISARAEGRRAGATALSAAEVAGPFAESRRRGTSRCSGAGTREVVVIAKSVSLWVRPAATGPRSARGATVAHGMARLSYRPVQLRSLSVSEIELIAQNGQLRGSVWIGEDSSLNVGHSCGSAIFRVPTNSKTVSRRPPIRFAARAILPIGGGPDETGPPSLVPTSLGSGINVRNSFNTRNLGCSLVSAEPPRLLWNGIEKLPVQAPLSADARRVDGAPNDRFVTRQGWADFQVPIVGPCDARSDCAR
jgi:hypothetical protein